MTTRTHRAVRKLAPLLDRIEPYAVFVAYIGAGIMAYFAWFHPPKVAYDLGNTSGIIEASLLTIGAFLGLWGHLANHALIEFYGLVACIGGVVILLSIVLHEFTRMGQYNYGQFIGLILLSLGMMFSHAFKLYHEITQSWINLPPTIINKIYTET